MSKFLSQPRRVVTFHDDDGNACVWKDEVPEPVRVCAPGTPAGNLTVRVTEIWHTEKNPDDNASSRDVAGEITAKGALSALHYDHGAVFRTVDFPPNHGDKSHRTQSIDFAMVISGEIYMELEPGQEILLKTGDTLVQRGTIHKWINRTDAYTRVLFVLLGAQPLKAEEANKADYNLNE